MSQRHRADLELLYTINDRTQLLKKATAEPPFGPAFDTALVQQAERMEVWGTADAPPHADYTEFHLVKDNKVLAVARIPGY